MRVEPLRRRLLLLAAAAIIPLAAMAGLALFALAQEHRAQAERAAIEITRALATAIDAELHRAVAALEGSAVGPALDTGELERYHRVMQRILEGRSDWITLTLADPAGQQLLNARTAFGERLPKVVDPDSLERVRQGQRPPFLIAVTGYGLPEDRERALAAGFDEHLAKPVDITVLANLLAKNRFS